MEHHISDRDKRSDAEKMISRDTGVSVCFLSQHVIFSSSATFLFLHFVYFYLFGKIDKALNIL